MRELFHTPDNYFLSHSVGALPKAAQSALETHYFAPWKSGENWALWMGSLDRYRAGLAAMLSVEAANICPQINVSSALTKILYSLPPPPNTKNTILLSRQDFPTIGFAAAQAQRQGYALKFIGGHASDLNHWEDAIDDTVAIVHITHALSNSSHLLPAAAICRLAREKGAISIVDAAQSIGAVEINAVAWDADFIIGTGVKFLCAGPGACFLYASPRVLPHCQPLDVGWFSHENPFEMDITQFRYAPDAMRFFGGTPSPAPFITAGCALDIWNAQAPHSVAAKIQSNLTQLWERLPPQIIASPSDPAHRGAAFVLAPQQDQKMPADIRQKMSRALKGNAILFDERPEGFRFSVHSYTSKSELTTLADCILSVLP